MTAIASPMPTGLLGFANRTLAPPNVIPRDEGNGESDHFIDLRDDCSCCGRVHTNIADDVMCGTPGHRGGRLFQ